MDCQPGTSCTRSRQSETGKTRYSITVQDKRRCLETLVNQTLDESDYDEDIDDSDNDPDYVEESEHDSESEIEFEENNSEGLEEHVEHEGREEEVLEERHEEPDEENHNLALENVYENQNRRRGDNTYFYGRQTKDMKKKNVLAFRWRKQEPSQNVRTRQENIVTQLPGLKSTAKDLGENPDGEEILNLLLTPDILEEILKWTNKKIGQVRSNYNRTNLSYVHETDLIELKGFIGLLIYTAAFKSGHESVVSLFATDGTGREIFRNVMTKERFLFLLKVLRFDNPEDRDERKKKDEAAAISNIFNIFIENCQKCYSPGTMVCVDEMLAPFRGRCKFRIYMRNKPAKYGLKIQCLTDAKTHYLFNAYIYTGKGSDGKTLTDDERKKLLIPTQAVLRLVKPIEGTRRNVTTDNWYSSIQLTQELKNKKLTLVGTLKKNKLEIPIAFLPNKNRIENSTLYGFTEDLTLLSFVPKKNKVVIMLSSMHHGATTDLSTNKPEIIVDYNHTKGGVDTVDQMCANYSVARRTKRWPMVIFYVMINVAAGVNSYVLYQSYKETPKITRLDFMKMLAKSFVSPLMFRRVTAGSIPRDLTFSIQRILQTEVKYGSQPQENCFEKRKTCAFCPPKLKRKTKYPCAKCCKPICLECSRKVCCDCIKRMDD